MQLTALTALDQFAHELRNAASVVVTGSRLLTDSGNNDDPAHSETRLIASDVLVAGLQLATMVDRLVEVARADLAAIVERQEITLGALFDLSHKRFQRSLTVADTRSASYIDLPAAALLSVNVALAERVIADAMMMARDGSGTTFMDINRDGPWWQVEFDIASSIQPEARESRANMWLLTSRLAAASGCEVDLLAEPERVIIRLPAVEPQ